MLRTSGAWLAEPKEGRNQWKTIIDSFPLLVPCVPARPTSLIPLVAEWWLKVRFLHAIKTTYGFNPPGYYGEIARPGLTVSLQGRGAAF